MEMGLFASGAVALVFQAFCKRAEMAALLRAGSAIGVARLFFGLLAMPAAASILLLIAG